MPDDIFKDSARDISLQIFLFPTFFWGGVGWGGVEQFIKAEKLTNLCYSMAKR